VGGADAEVVAAGLADVQVARQLLAVQDFLAPLALDPQVGRRVLLDQGADARFRLAEPFHVVFSADFRGNTKITSWAGASNTAFPAEAAFAVPWLRPLGGERKRPPAGSLSGRRTAFFRKS